MEKQETFTAFEGFSLLSAALLFHVYSGSLPGAAKECGNAAWIAWILSSVLSIGLFFLYYLLYRMFPGKNIMEITETVLGKYLGKLCNLLLLLFLLCAAVLNLREAVDILVANTYSHTRLIVLSLAFITIGYIVASYPVKGLARTASVCVPLFFGAILFILLLSSQQYEPYYLHPLLGHGVEPILKNGVTQLTSYDGLLIVSVFLGSFGAPKYYRKSALWAVVLCSVLFFLSALFFSMTLPYQALKFSRSGLLDIAQSIYISRFLQRFESIFIIFVAMGKTVVLCIILLSMKRVFCHLSTLPEKRENKALLPLCLLVLAFTQMAQNLPYQQIYFGQFMRAHSLFYTLGLLFLLLAVGFLRSRKPKGGGGRVVRATSLLLVCALSITMLSGCTNISEPDEEIFSIVMGYDRSDTETLRITVKVMPEDKNSAGGSGGGEFPDEEGKAGNGVPDNVFTVDAPCNIPAADLINTVIPKHLSMLHVKMLVVSEELARENLDLLVTPFIRYNEIKPSIAVVIVRETAEEFISSKSSELIPFLPLETEMIIKKNKGNASYLVRTMGDIYESYMSDYGDALVMYGGLTHGGKNKIEEEEAAGESSSPEEKKDGEDLAVHENEELKMTLAPSDPDDPELTPEGTKKLESPSVYYDDPSTGYLQGYYPGDIPLTTSAELQIAGMAVLKDTRMVGALNTSETSMFMVANGTFPGAVLALRDPYIENYYVIFFGRSRQKNKVKTSIDQDGNARIDIECFLHLEIEIVHNSETNYEEPEQKELLRLYAQEYYESEIAKLIQKVQKEYQSDVLHLGRYMAKNFLTIEEWEAYDWPSHYPDAEINVSVNVRI